MINAIFQVLVDFYTNDLSADQLIVIFGSAAGKVDSVWTFQMASAVLVVLQAPLITLAGEVEVVTFFIIDTIFSLLICVDWR